MLRWHFICHFLFEQDFYTVLFQNTEMKSDLVSSALRIYLTCLQQQTDDVIQSCRLQMSVRPAASDSKVQHLWKVTTDAASEVSASIKEFQLNSSHDIGVLSVVDALQDALRAAMYRAQLNDVSDLRSYGRLFVAHASRAKYMTYGFMALKNNDLELSSLWFLAAQSLHRAI